MTDENGEAVVEQETGDEEERATNSSGISETKAAILKERAETQLEEQNRRIELLMNQADRLKTIKYGVLTLLLLVGLYSGPEIADPPNTEFVTSIVWFSVVGFSIAFSTIFSKYLGGLSQRFSFKPSQDPFVENIVDELIEASSAHVGEEAKSLDEKAKKIAEKEHHIKQLEDEIGFAHLILAIILITLIGVGLPSFALSDFFILVVAI